MLRIIFAGIAAVALGDHGWAGAQSRNASEGFRL